MQQNQSFFSEKNAPKAICSLKSSLLKSIFCMETDAANSGAGAGQRTPAGGR